MGILNITEQSSFRREYNIGNITLHPEYRRQLNDIALITTAETIEFSSNLYPACLYQNSDDPLGLTITGWGRTTLGREYHIINLSGLNLYLIFVYLFQKMCSVIYY